MIFFRNETKKIDLDNFVIGSYPFFEQFGVCLLYTSFSLDEALALIRRVAPRRAYLTHMSHEMGLYAERSALLPEGVYLAYDGLEINVND